MSGIETDFGYDPATKAVEESTWEPGADVLHHSGYPLLPGREFFVAAPPEIGEVLTASSTLKVGKKPMPVVSRMLLCGVIGSVGWSIIHFVYPQGGPILEGLAATGLAVVTFLVTQFRHECNFVGRLGVARFTCSGRRDRLVRRDIFPFETAEELRTSQTRHYHNGVYTGTQYQFVWTDVEGKRRFRLNGMHRGENKPPKPASPFHFAEAAEVAWSQYRLDHAVAELDSIGSIRFNLGGGDWLAVGPGFLDLNIKGQVARCEVAEIAGVSIRGGVFEVRRNDAKVGWFSKTGVFKFEYAKMANARVFLMAMAKLVGVVFS